VSADEITVDQTDLTRTGVTVVTCRDVTSVSAGYEIPASKELTLELDARANLYPFNPAGLVPSSPPRTTVPAAAKAFSAGLPKLDLSLLHAAIRSASLSPRKYSAQFALWIRFPHRPLIASNLIDAGPLISRSLTRL